MILGAILAGGRARRFGGDKAAALANGVALIDRVAATLRPQCDRLVVVGRDWAGVARVEDWPAPGLGPLGGLAGALRHALTGGYERVLTSACDLPDVPADLLARLTPGPAVVAGQPLLGLWPAALADLLSAHVVADPKRTMRGWITASGTREIVFTEPLVNINTRGDLACYHAGDVRPAGPRSSP